MIVLPPALRHHLCFAVMVCLLPCTIVGLLLPSNAQAPPSPLPAVRSPNEQLFDSANQGDIAQMQMAISRGADINAQAHSGKQTVLMWVAQARNSPEVMAFLLQQHPDLSLRDNGGNTVMHFVIEPPGYDEQEARKLGTDAYFRIQEQRKLRIVQMLLEHGAKVNDVDDFGFTPLQALVNRHGSAALISLLARYGAALNVTGKKGKAALHMAVEENEWHLVQALLNAHADPNVKDAEGRTAVMLAYANDVNQYKMLVDAGANVNARDKEGRTPLIALFEAAYLSRSMAHTDNEGEFKPERIAMPDERCLTLLFRKGAKVNARNKLGVSALEWAQNLLSACESEENRQTVERYIRILKNARAKR